MKKDVRIKIRPRDSFASKFVRHQLVYLLKLSDELETVYQTYPRLRSLVGYSAWQELTDSVYRQLLELNLAPRNRELRRIVVANFTRLEDISSSTLIRDHTALRDTLSRVLQFRLINKLATDRSK